MSDMTVFAQVMLAFCAVAVGRILYGLYDIWRIERKTPRGRDKRW